METSDIGVNSAAVTELVPNWTYNVMVRCGTTEHFWKWSPWSSAITFHTETDGRLLQKCLLLVINQFYHWMAVQKRVF